MELEVTTLMFTRAEKSPRMMEEQINEALKGVQFKTAVLAEHPGNGWLYLRLYHTKPTAGSKQTICRVIRDYSIDRVDAEENELLKDQTHELKLPLTVIGAKSNNLFVLLFFNKKEEAKKAQDKKSEKSEEDMKPSDERKN